MKRANYYTLYAAYVDGGTHPDKFLSYASPLRGKKVVDLCAGDGRITRSALEAGAERVFMVDRDTDMLDPELIGHERVYFEYGRNTEWALNVIPKFTTVDAVFCRQGVNYWLDRAEYGGRLAKLIAPGGVFVFNTFKLRPPERPRVKQYELNGRRYTEVSWVVGSSSVHHIQICDDMAADYTHFDWLPPVQLKDWLSPFFDVTVEEGPTTALFICHRKRS